jgi:hypothetical protein
MAQTFSMSKWYSRKDRDGNYRAYCDVKISSLKTYWEHPGICGDLSKAVLDMHKTVLRDHSSTYKKVHEIVNGFGIGYQTGSGAVCPAGVLMHNDSDYDGVIVVIPGYTCMIAKLNMIDALVEALRESIEEKNLKKHLVYYVPYYNKICIKYPMEHDVIPGLTSDDGIAFIMIEFTFRDVNTPTFNRCIELSGNMESLKPVGQLFAHKQIETGCASITFQSAEFEHAIRMMYAEILKDDEARWLLWFLRAMNKEKVPTFMFAIVVSIAKFKTDELYSRSSNDLLKTASRLMVMMDATYSSIQVLVGNFKRSWCGVENSKVYCFLDNQFNPDATKSCLEQMWEGTWLETILSEHQLKNWNAWREGSLKSLQTKKIFPEMHCDSAPLIFYPSFMLLRIMALTANIVSRDLQHKEGLMRSIVHNGNLMDLLSITIQREYDNPIIQDLPDHLKTWFCEIRTTRSLSGNSSDAIRNVSQYIFQSVGQSFVPDESVYPMPVQIVCRAHDRRVFA